MSQDRQKRSRSFEPQPQELSDKNWSFYAEPSNWSLFYHMIKNMKSAQLAGIVERKARHAVVPRLPVDFDAQYDRSVPDKLSPNPEPLYQNLEKLKNAVSDSERARYRDQFDATLDGTYTFLNRTIDFDGGIDWKHEKLSERTELWLIKFQSFEHLKWLVIGYDSLSTAPEFGPIFERQLLSWKAANPIGEKKYLRRSWVPHAVSLRILNWSRYAAWSSQTDTEFTIDRLYREIYRNALFLSNHVEHDIGGNHLIENGIALLTAGVLFREHDTGWIDNGLTLLRDAGRRQFLGDGGHFERSPMYHIMTLRRYITAYDLATKSGLPVGGLERIAELAAGFLSEISEPNQQIPLLNDSVYRDRLTAGDCLTYGAECTLQPRNVSLNRDDGSGYRKLSSDAGTLLIDVGDVGPPSLPAHSHNDQLSVLLWIDGEPLLTDTGVYDYGSNPRRQYARSVRAHNTAQCDNIEPIPIGGSYLMGKRTSTDLTQSDNRTIHANCRRESLAGPEYTHYRRVATTDDGWTISDSIESDQTTDVTIRYHFHPSIEAEGSDDGFTAYRCGRQVAKFRFSGQTEQTLTTSPYFEQYGTERQRSSIVTTAKTNDKIISRISTDSHTK